MKAEVTVTIDIDYDDDEYPSGPRQVADEIENDAVSFLSQYGEITVARVQVLDGKETVADTGAPVPVKAKASKRRKAVKASGVEVDADARFRLDLPDTLPEMDPDAVEFVGVEPHLIGSGDLDARALDHEMHQPQERRRRRKGKA